MLDGGNQAVVVCVGGVTGKRRAGATAKKLVALIGIRNGERKAGCLISNGGTCRTGCSWLDFGRTCCNDACATRASCSPHSGDVDGGTYRQANGSMDGCVANVLELKLPAATELLLDAGCPLHGIGRVVVRGKDDVLGLRVEER